MHKLHSPSILLRRGPQISKGNNMNMSLEEVMADFRRNGRDVDPDLEPGNNMSADARRLFYGLMQQEQRRVEQDVKIPRPYHAFSKSTFALYSFYNNFAGWEAQSTPHRARLPPNYRKCTLEVESHTWDDRPAEGRPLRKQGFSSKPGVRGQPYQSEAEWDLRDIAQANTPAALARRAAQAKVLRPVFAQSTVYSSCKSIQSKPMKQQPGILILNAGAMRDDNSEHGSSDKENFVMGMQPSKKAHSKTDQNRQFGERTVSLSCRSVVLAPAASTPPLAPANPLPLAARKPRGRAAGSSSALADTQAKSKTKSVGRGTPQENVTLESGDGRCRKDKTKGSSQKLLPHFAFPPKPANGAGVVNVKRKAYADVVSQEPTPKITDESHNGVEKLAVFSSFKELDGLTRKYSPTYSDVVSPKGGRFGEMVGKVREFPRSKMRDSPENRQSPECAFCRTNGETSSMYRTHVLKDEFGRTVCEVLRKYICPLCGATGDNAHTVKYCPQNLNPPAVATMTTLKSMRSSTGTIRWPNTRKSPIAAKEQRKSFGSFSSSCSHY